LIVLSVNLPCKFNVVEPSLARNPGAWQSLSKNLPVSFRMGGGRHDVMTPDDTGKFTRPKLELPARLCHL
jgi:hypothetical protein